MVTLRQLRPLKGELDDEQTRVVAAQGPLFALLGSCLSSCRPTGPPASLASASQERQPWEAVGQHPLAVWVAGGVVPTLGRSLELPEHSWLRAWLRDL